MKFLISYDLDRPGQDYRTLISGLEKSGAKRVLKSAWAIDTSWTATQIRDWVKRVTDVNDRVVVTELGKWSAYNTMTNINNI